MKRSGLAVLAGLALVLLIGGNVAVASPPATPHITSITVKWGWYVWDDGVSRCTLIADASLDRSVTKGQQVVASAYAHTKWVGPGGGTWSDFNYWNVKLTTGVTRVHTYTAFMGDGSGYYVVDSVRFDLVSSRTVISTMRVATINPCMNA